MVGKIGNICSFLVVKEWLLITRGGTRCTGGGVACELMCLIYKRKFSVVKVFSYKVRGYVVEFIYYSCLEMLIELFLMVEIEYWFRHLSKLCNEV